MHGDSKVSSDEEEERKKENEVKLNVEESGEEDEESDEEDFDLPSGAEEWLNDQDIIRDNTNDGRNEISCRVFKLKS